MADMATPSAATMSTIDAGAEPTQKAQKPKPEKPDEEQYKKDLAKAEKDNASAQEEVVSRLIYGLTIDPPEHLYLTKIS